MTYIYRFNAINYDVILDIRILRGIQNHLGDRNIEFLPGVHR